MSFVRGISNGLFDALLAPFRAETPWPGLVAVALLAAVVVLLIFRVASNPAAIRRQRDRLLARVLELVLFKEDLVVSLGAFGRVLAANGRYLAALVVPLALSLVPVWLIVAQAQAWFGLRPLRPGETTILTARFSPAAPALAETAALTASPGLRVEAAVRDPSRREVSWRVRVVDGAAAWVEVAAGGRTQRQRIEVGRALAPVAARRTAGGFWSSLKCPRAEPLPAGGGLDQLELDYPARELRLGGRSINWLVAFFVLTLACGFVLRKPLGVEL